MKLSRASTGAGLLAAVFLVLASIAPALANWTGKDASGNTITFYNTGTCSSVVCIPIAEPVDNTGAALGVTGNPLYIGFGTGVQLPGFAVAPSVKLQDGSGNVINSTSGNLDVQCSNCSGSGVSATFGSAIGTVGTPSGFKDSSGNFQSLLGDVTNGQWVSVKGTLPAFASTPTVNIGTAPTIAVTGTFWQTTQPVSAASLPLPTGAATQTTLASVLSALGSPFQAGGSIGNTSFGATQGNAGSNAQAWWAQIGDTSHGPVAVKAASTAAAASDPSLVVALSPNNTLPLSASGGWSRTLFTSLSTTVQTVKSSAGQVAKLYCDNPNPSAIYVETFDVSGSVTLGTTAPTQAYYIPAVSATGFVMPVQGDQYSNAIKIAAVTSVNGSTAPSTPGNCNISWN